MQDPSREEWLLEAAHELKTPIAIISGNLDLFEKGNEKEKKRAARIIRNTVAGMSSLVNNILYAARDGSPAGGGILEAEPFSADELIAEVREDCLVLALNKKIDIRVLKAGGPSAEIFLSVGRSRIKEILFNLISNALRHTPAGGSILLSAERMDQEKAVIKVRDTGCGIAAEEQERIFERFYRIGTDSPLSGNGLGLHLCRRIAETYGGTITVESEPGKGSAFSLILPVAAGS